MFVNAVSVTAVSRVPTSVVNFYSTSTGEPQLALKVEYEISYNSKLEAVKAETMLNE